MLFILFNLLLIVYVIKQYIICTVYGTRLFSLHLKCPFYVHVFMCSFMVCVSALTAAQIMSSTQKEDYWHLTNCNG